MAVEKDIVDKSGSWYSYGNDRIGQGRENAKNYLADHPEVMAEIKQKVREAYGIAEPTTEDSKAGTDEKAKDKSKNKTAAKATDPSTLDV